MFFFLAVTFIASPFPTCVEGIDGEHCPQAPDLRLLVLGLLAAYVLLVLFLLVRLVRREWRGR